MNKTSKFRWGFRPKTAPPKENRPLPAPLQGGAVTTADDEQPPQSTESIDMKSDEVYIKKILTSDISHVKHKLTDDSRGAFAQMVFPYLSAHSAGKLVAEDIKHYPELKAQLEAVGYRPKVQGYTPEQRTILTNFYSLQGRL